MISQDYCCLDLFCIYAIHPSTKSRRQNSLYFYLGIYIGPCVNPKRVQKNATMSLTHFSTPGVYWRRVVYEGRVTKLGYRKTDCGWKDLNRKLDIFLGQCQTESKWPTESRLPHYEALEPWRRAGSTGSSVANICLDHEMEKDQCHHPVFMRNYGTPNERDGPKSSTTGRGYRAKDLSCTGTCWSECQEEADQISSVTKEASWAWLGWT